MTGGPAAGDQTTASARALPLAGVRVLELGQLLAGPFAGTFLGAFGADVVKLEPPGSGDPIRTWRVLDAEGTSLWWASLARNKRSLTLDLRVPEGQAIARRLAARADVLIENFRPGTLERWGLAPDVLWQENPRLVIVRISGYGQDGPHAARPGYASVCEAVGGLRHLTGHPGEPPVRANLSLADSVAGLHAALGVLLALRERETSGRGQVVDVALTESVLNLLEAVIPEADRGAVRGPSGTTITGVAPTNLYRTRDSRWVVIAANGESNFRRLMETVGRADLATDPRMAGNPGRVRHQAELDEAIGRWAAAHDLASIVETLGAAGVPAGAVQDGADLLADPQLLARDAFETVERADGALRLPRIFPHLTATPASTRWPGAALGAHSDEVLREAGLDEATIARLRAAGVV